MQGLEVEGDDILSNSFSSFGAEPEEEMKEAPVLPEPNSYFV